MRTALLFSVLIPLALLATPAFAAGDATSRAKERFAAGAQAYREARYKDAIDLFLEANKLDPHAELIFNVGQAYEKLGDVPNALRSYREYLRLQPGAQDRPTVEASIRNLEARLREKGVQQVSVFSTPAGAAVFLDQKDVGATPWTGEISPGRHVVVLKASGFPDTAKEFILTADRAMDLDVTLGVSGSSAVPIGPGDGPKDKPPVEPPPPDEPRHVRPWTWAVLGVGVGSLGAALGLEVARKSAENAARADNTQVGFSDKYDQMTTRQTAARVMVGVGAGLVVVGGVLLVVDLRKPSAPSQQKVGFGCFQGACGALASGSF